MTAARGPGGFERAIILGSSLTILLTALCAASAGAQTGVRFSRQVTYAVGQGPISVAVGDLDGDGNLDLAVANQGSVSVSFLFGDGHGGFPRRIDYSTGPGPHSVAIADLNHDGLPDVVIANTQTSDVTTLINVGHAVFSRPALLQAGASPYWISAVDLNGDGSPDLAVANNGSNTVSIWLGSPSGSFGPRHDYPTGGGPSCIAVGDFNGDGKPDLAVACAGMGGVSILLGDGTGAFGSRVDVPTGSEASAVVAGDLNGDGYLDLAVSNHGSNTVSILLGNGQGGFSPASTALSATGPRTLAIGDLNGDGHLDLVVPDDLGSSASVFLGNGAGQFAPGPTLTTGASPYAVAIAGFNGDAMPDLAVANSGASTVSVFLQLLPGAPTSCTLTSSPNPSVWNQPVMLTATVTPATVTGTVDFTDGAAIIASLPLANGVASADISQLAPGSHSLIATYSGDATNNASTSPTVTQIVNKLTTATMLTSSPNPSDYTQTVTFTATVSVQPAGAGQPTGTVQFKIDDVSAGTVALDASGTAVMTTSALGGGDHSVQAIYGGDQYSGGSSSPLLTHTVRSPNPTIIAVRDVPNDEGGHVFVTWRSPLDHPGARLVTGYRVWRRAPNPGAASARPAGESGRAARPGGAALDGYWEAIASLPAEQLVNYAYEATTAQDSMAGSNPYTAFVVTALTSDPFVFFESAPDSGYSVDNLSPPAPAPFVAVYLSGSTQLRWGTNPAPDVLEFRLYRGPGPDFVPGPNNLVIATRDTSYVDVGSTPCVYKLDAIDIHGNASRYAMVTPSGPVAALASLISIDADANRVSLSWYSAGNAGMAATIYRRTEATDWVALSQQAFDGTGTLPYTDTSVQTGMRYGYRLGIMDGGAETFVAEGWATAGASEVALEGARPNPTVAGAVKVAFTLSSAERARLELIDVSGRLVAIRDVGALGPGPHMVDLEEGGRVPPGVYLIRLTAASRSFTRRVAVLP